MRDLPEFSPIRRPARWPFLTRPNDLVGGVIWGVSRGVRPAFWDGFGRVAKAVERGARLRQSVGEYRLRQTQKAALSDNDSAAFLPHGEPYLHECLHCVEVKHHHLTIVWPVNSKEAHNERFWKNPAKFLLKFEWIGRLAASCPNACPITKTGCGYHPVSNDVC
jgi:hypothetical protein